MQMDTKGYKGLQKVTGTILLSCKVQVHAIGAGRWDQRIAKGTKGYKGVAGGKGM